MEDEVLARKFFERSALKVAKELLGKYLMRRFEDGKKAAFMITEVEAYDGHEDKASHAARGMTARNRIMFGPAGFWYVYFVYGMHWMLNIVTGPENYPAAILIRGAASSTSHGTGEYDGPAKLTKVLKIDGSLNALEARPKSDLWIEDRGSQVNKDQIIALPRVGVNYAGPIWSKKKYRFALFKKVDIIKFK